MGKAKIWYEKIDPAGKIELSGKVKVSKVSVSSRSRIRGFVSVQKEG